METDRDILSVWFAGILAASGSVSLTTFLSDFTESVYQYIAGGAAEMVLLAVVRSGFRDEPYKISAVKMYMVDYLDNICAFRLKRQRDVRPGIHRCDRGRTPESRRFNASSIREARAWLLRCIPENRTPGKCIPGKRVRGKLTRHPRRMFGQMTERTAATQQGTMQQNTAREGERNSSQSSGRGIFRRGAQKQESELPINIEGEPRNVEKAGNESQNVQRPVPDQNIRRPAGNQEEDDDRPVLREEAIRQILEEFLA